MSRPIPEFSLVNPVGLEPGLGQALALLEKDAVVRRIWQRDPSVWKPLDVEISNRLGWLDAPDTAVGSIPDLEAFAASVRGLGLTRAVVLGMGGSSLAPEVFGRLFPTGPDGLELEVLDTTGPEDVAAAAARFPSDKTLFVVSSKSGTTSEMAALFSFFYARAVAELGDGARIEEGEQGSHLGGRPRLRRHDEQRLVGGESGRRRGHVLRPGRVEDLELETVGSGREEAAEDLGGQARAAHAQDDRAGQSQAPDGGGEGLEIGDAPDGRVGRVEPAQPVGDLDIQGLPDGGVPLPDAADDGIFLEEGQRLAQTRLEPYRIDEGELGNWSAHSGFLFLSVPEL